MLGKGGRYKIVLENVCDCLVAGYSVLRTTFETDLLDYLLIDLVDDRCMSNFD